MVLGEESRLLSIRVLQNFVRETGGQWGRVQWQQLLQRIRRMGFAMITEEQIRNLCERNSERWLSGDNSVEAPAPVEPPELREEPEPAGYSDSREEAPAGQEEGKASYLAFAAPVAHVPVTPTPEERARPVGKAKKAGKMAAKKRARKKKPKKAKKKSTKKSAKKKPK